MQCVCLYTTHNICTHVSSHVCILLSNHVSQVASTLYMLLLMLLSFISFLGTPTSKVPWRVLSSLSLITILHIEHIVVATIVSPMSRFCLPSACLHIGFTRKVRGGSHFGFIPSRQKAMFQINMGTYSQKEGGPYHQGPFDAIIGVVWIRARYYIGIFFRNAYI